MAPASAGAGRTVAAGLFGRGVEHVVDPVHVAAQQQQLQPGGDQGGQRLEEAGGQGAQSQHGAQRQPAVEHLLGPDGQDQQRRDDPQAGHGGIDHGAQAAPGQADVDLVDEQVGPVAGGALLGTGGLERLDAGEHLEHVALRARLDLQALGREPLGAPPGQDENQHLQAAEGGGHQADLGVDGHQQDEVQTHQRPVQQGGDGAGGQQLPHKGVGAQPHHQVTGRAFQEEGVGQVDQVLDEADGQLEVELGAQPQQQMGPQERARHEVGGHDGHGRGDDAPADGRRGRARPGSTTTRVRMGTARAKTRSSAEITRMRRNRRAWASIGRR